jgi:hypothetical protein
MPEFRERVLRWLSRGLPRDGSEPLAFDGATPKIGGPFSSLEDVRLDLAVGGGTLRLGGRDLPYTHLAIDVSTDDAPHLTVETIALGGVVEGTAAMRYRVEFIDSLDRRTWPRGEGETIGAALRALADELDRA